MNSRRIKNILFLIKILLRAFSRGKASKAPKVISKIIIAPPGKLGDVVCTTPVFAAVRKHFPNAKIVAAGNSKLHRALLADSNLVDEYLDEKEISSAQADVALVTSPSFELAAPLYLAGIPMIIASTAVGGFSPMETVPYQILKKFIKTVPFEIEKYAPRERLRVLEPLGIISDDTTKHLDFSAIAREKIEKLLTDNQIDAKDFVVGISPSSGNKIKEWPTERFAEVADYMVEKYKAKIILIGGPSDKPLIEKAKNSMAIKPLLDCTDSSIDELKALISKLDLFIAVDTGPIYIAEAFNVPTIDIVGPVDENVQPPIGRIHRSVVPKRTKAELFILNARTYDVREAMRQILSITVEDVKREIDSLMADINA